MPGRRHTPPSRCAASATFTVEGASKHGRKAGRWDLEAGKVCFRRPTLNCARSKPLAGETLGLGQSPV